jgi:hypothetical protein
MMDATERLMTAAQEATLKRLANERWRTCGEILGGGVTMASSARPGTSIQSGAANSHSIFADCVPSLGRVGVVLPDQRVNKISAPVSKNQVFSATIRCEQGRFVWGHVVRDRDVRQALHRKLLKEHHGDANTLVLDELGLRHGACRVDIAVVNGFLHGYEIKSDADTLERLPAQVAIYSAVLDRATLVVGESHVEKAKLHLPDWWGIKVVITGPRGGISFDTARPVDMNPAIDPLALAELLWRPEAVEILRSLRVPEALLRKPRGVLYEHLASTMDIRELRSVIRQRLKARARWRGHRPPSSDVGSLIPTPM